ncbi:MAG: hypothetical protein ACYC6Y_29505 [Thermoguttaceae bacterium]
MTPARMMTTITILIVGTLAGGVGGFLLVEVLDPKGGAAAAPSAELAQIRAELAELKGRGAPLGMDDQLAQLHGIVTDILLRGDEFAIRADFARNADRFGGRPVGDFALRDGDGDGRDDLEELRQMLEGIVAGTTPVGLAKKADSAANAEFFANLPLTDFALADHNHPVLEGDVRVVGSGRVDGTFTVTGSTIASGAVQVFGEVVAVGGLMPGDVNVDPKPELAGLIRYNRRTGALEYCDGSRWNEVAVVATQP